MQTLGRCDQAHHLLPLAVCVWPLWIAKKWCVSFWQPFVKKLRRAVCLGRQSPPVVKVGWRAYLVPQN